MNKQESNQLGQYTVPTTPREQAFYSRHSGAITRYTFAVIGIQLAWSFFSYNPAMALLTENTTMLPDLQLFLPILSGAILGILHFVLKAETLETFSNIMDKDETTINGAWNYLIPIIVCAGLFMLDVKGVSTTLRDKSFDGKKTELSTESQKQLDKAKADYNTAIAAIASTKRDDEAAAVAPFASQFAQAAKMVHNDDQDRAAKARKVNSISRERDLALANVRKEASTAQKQALQIYNSEKARITGKLDSAHSVIDGQDAANAAKADSYSWGVSVFFMLIFLLMNYKLVYLRVNSGIRINKEFTQLDAEGSFLEKLQRVVTSIAQRQGHRFLVFFHKIGSTGTATLSTFDGRVILQQSSYNGSQVTPPSVLDLSNDDLTGGTTQTPPPLPPAPPKNGNGGDDGNGGDRTAPPSVPVPSNSIAQPQTATASAVATATFPKQESLIAAQADLGYTSPMTSAQSGEVIKLAAAYEAREAKNWNDGAAFIPDPTTPSVVETPKTPVEAPKTVTTNNIPPVETTKTVTTAKTPVTTDNSEFSYWDKLIRDFKSDFQKELANLRSKNGTEDSIMKRLVKKQRDFDMMVRESKATPKLKGEISNWVFDNISPLVTAFLKGDKEGSNE